MNSKQQDQSNLSKRSISMTQKLKAPCIRSIEDDVNVNNSTVHVDWLNRMDANDAHTRCMHTVCMLNMQTDVDQIRDHITLVT